MDGWWRRGRELEKPDLVHQAAEEDGDVFDLDILEDWVIPFMRRDVSDCFLWYV